MRSLLSFTLLLSLGCRDHDDTGKELHDPRLINASSPGIQELVAGNNEFAWDFYRAVKGASNEVYAPFTLSSSLGMVLAGANGLTETEMEEVLHLGLEQSAWHTAHGELIRDLIGEHPGRSYTLSGANRAWGQSGYPWEEAFLEILADDYGAPMGEIDFASDPAAAEEAINAWASEQTGGHIEELIPSGTLTPATRLALGSALYTYARWVLPFAKEMSREGEFYLADGSVVLTPVMSRYDEAWYYTSEKDLEVVQLLYQDQELAFYIVLPTERDGLEAIEETLTADRVQTWIDDIQTRDHYAYGLGLPRFGIEHRAELSGTLGAMGMPSAFDAKQADFSGMSTAEPSLHLSHALHGAFISVDEAGTEAGGVSVEISSNGDPIVIHCNHPFMFFLRDELSGAILYMGRLVDPTL